LGADAKVWDSYLGKEGAIYGPFSVGYEIKEVLSPGWVPTYNDPDNINGHPNAEPIQVAILYDDTPERPGLREALREVKANNKELRDSYNDPIRLDFRIKDSRGFPTGEVIEEAKVTPEKEESQVSKLKLALQDKIRQFEAYKTDPRYQTEMEQNAVVVTLRELRYLDSIAEYE
jgi:hypothetical protein